MSGSLFLQQMSFESLSLAVRLRNLSNCPLGYLRPLYLRSPTFLRKHACKILSTQIGRKLARAATSLSFYKQRHRMVRLVGHDPKQTRDELIGGQSFSRLDSVGIADS